MSTTEKVMVTAPSGSDLPLPPSGLVTTPPGMQDIRLVPMTKLRQIIVRTVRTYLQALLGMLTLKFGGAAIGVDAIGTDPVIPQVAPYEFFGAVVECIGYALAPAFFTLLWNSIELLSDYDDPKTRA